MNEPVIKPARFGPRMVTTGMRAFLIIWRVMTVPSARPLERAVRM